MIKYFCSSDIHSFYTEWMLSLKSKGFDVNNPEHKIIVCGDLLDRGDESVKCVEFMRDMIAQNRAIYIRGNHEDLLFECCYSLGRYVGSHHKSNGTIKTISHFLEMSEYDVLCDVWDSKDYNNKLKPLLEFVHDNAVDYYEVGNKIFVHGWVPTTIASKDDHTTIIHENWRDGGWKEARWENGMEMYRFGITIPDKTIVCGHWHTSYGHRVLTKQCESEFGPDACFDALILDGIIALDACTAYTHNVNVIVINEDGDLIG